MTIVCTLDRKKLREAEYILQGFAATLKAREKKRVHVVMRMLDDTAMVLRRKAIFQAGAKAKKPEPRFEDDVLGSAESYNFYDGYASTHPGFVNPYRSR